MYKIEAIENNESLMASNAMHYNSKCVVVVIVVAAFVLYFVYNILPGNRSGGNLKHFSSWKTRKFEQIPEEVKRLAENVKIVHRHISVNHENKDFNIFIQEYKSDKPNTVTILFLHGHAFTSDTWVTLGTLGLVAAMGYNFMAVDLPGYGNSKDSPLHDDHDRGNFLEKFIKMADLDRPVIVTPSMSGSFSIPYMMKKSPSTCTERLRGLVAVAPTKTETYIHAQYYRCEVPAMIIYGTEDRGLGLNSVGDLRNMPNSEIFPIEGAKHACYMEKPNVFHYLLHNFLQAVEREQD